MEQIRHFPMFYKGKSIHQHLYFYMKFNFCCVIKMNPLLPHSLQHAALKLRPECDTQNSERKL